MVFFLLLAGGQVIKVDDAQIIALALYPQLVQAVGGGSSDHVNVHAAGQHAAVLVVGMIAADLGAAGALYKPASAWVPKVASSPFSTAS